MSDDRPLDTLDDISADVGDGGDADDRHEAIDGSDVDERLSVLDEPREMFEPPHRSVRRMVAVALVAALVLSAVGVALVVALGEPEPAGRAGPIERAATGPAPGDAAFDELLAQLQEFVEQERGLEFVDDVDVELVGEGDFQARLLEDFEEDRAEIETAGRVLQAVGLMAPGTDLVGSLRSVLSAGVVGFYDPETDELVVRGTRLTPHVRVTLVHELVHALQDQHFELDRPELEDRDDEAGEAFSGLVEGDAVRVDEAYRATLSPEERRQAAAEELAAAGALDVTGVPPALVSFIAFPYLQGPTFAKVVLEEGGQGRLDQAFADPPTTTENILRPRRYLRGEDRIEVRTPRAEGDVIDEGVFGAWALALLFGDGVPTPQGLAAVDAWGGDWYVAWVRGDQTCVRTNVVGDRPAAFPALVAAVEAWAERRGSANVEVAGDLVSFTSCG